VSKPSGSKTTTKPSHESTKPFCQEFVSFVKAENPNCFGIDEAKWIASWGKVKDGPKKREMENTLTKMMAKQAELCMMRILFVGDILT